jgi:regulatory protein
LPHATNDGGEHLAPVTYLPGVTQPAAEWAVPGVDAGMASDGEPAPVTEPELPARQVKRASNVSLSGLSRRNLSRWELENLLRSRDLDDETVAFEIARLEGVGLIDDAALAETLVRTQHERKGLGRQAIIGELRRRHIDQAVIDAAMTGLDGDDERDRAFELAEKRAGQLSSYDHETAKRRLTGYLQRKGYNSGLVREAVDHALGSPRSNPGGVRFR